LFVADCGSHSAIFVLARYCRYFNVESRKRPKVFQQYKHEGNMSIIFLILRRIKHSIRFAAIVATLAGSSLANAADTYTIDPAHTRVGFSARHLGISNVKGSFKEFTGKLVMDGDALKEATATIQVQSIDTGVGSAITTCARLISLPPPVTAERTPPIRRMLELGIPVGAGTDAARVASYNPWVSLYWLTTGKNVGGVAMYPENNCLTREEALRLYTQGSSWFSSESGKKVAIAVGQLADLAALTDDYFSVPEQEIKGIESVLTIVDGKVVHATDEFASHAPPAIPVLPEWSPVKVFGGYGAPLDVRKVARAGVPVHQHTAECHSHGRLHAAQQLLAGIKAAAPRYSDFWGLGSDCFAF
jgi:hypothetical protein